MAERETVLRVPAERSVGGRVGDASAWLRERLLPGGENILAVAAHAMILFALISFAVESRPSPEVSPSRYTGALVALSALFLLHVFDLDLTRRLGLRKTSLIRLLGGAALFLLAVGLGGNSVFLPYLIFMFTADAFVELRLSRALAYSVGLLAAWFAVTGARPGPFEYWDQSLRGIGSGMLFSALFARTIVAFADQTERAERLLEELRAANAELAEAREKERDLAVAEERVRLAREIHDGLGHHLTVLGVQLQAAAKLVRRDPERAEGAIAVCREEAQAALDEVRQSVAAMRRDPLDGRPLPGALDRLVRDFDRHSPLATAFALHGEPFALSPAAEGTLYRAAQEGLTNAQKHAAASRVSVCLSYARGVARLTVEDDGAGGQEGVGGGFGLAGLRERAEQLGGAFEAGPGPRGGFRLQLSVPVDGEVGGSNT